MNVEAFKEKFYSLPIVKSFTAGIILTLLLSLHALAGQKSFEVSSPNGIIKVKIETGTKLQWSVTHDGQQIILPSDISLQLEDGTVLGENPKVTSSDKEEADNVITAINYKKAVIKDKYNQLTIKCKGDYGVIFRVYDDAAVYRFFTKKKGEIVIKNEEANFNFTGDHKAFIPFMWDYRNGKIFNNSFEALYSEINLSQFRKDSLAFLPVLVDVGGNKKVVITEADLEDYPGMFLNLNQTHKGFMGVYAPYPLEAEYNGQLNFVPTKRADYIARTNGTRSFPWRVVVISTSDKELLNSDIIQKLASPSRIKDVSWIQPGQVAWDWWNDWNISHVDFRAGINTAHRIFWWQNRLSEIPDYSEEKECLVHNTSDPL
ncbi:MAG: glycoside hydrolase family 97 N-terminal domain-containing protein, partial [Ignavibacteriaceae bacterium]|nr:glycoside hydrolase family 97 N-terminal domain-containing protein [Ignavibacteriaceae bacterium]